MPVVPRELRAVVDSGQPIPRSYHAVLRLMDGRTKSADLDNVEGSADSKQTVRRQATITVATRDRKILPVIDAAHVFCRVYLGKRVFVLPIGSFTIDQDSGHTLLGSSFEQLVMDLGFTAPWECAGTSVALMTNLIKQVDPDAHIIIRDGVKDVPVMNRTYDPSSDSRRAAMDDLAVMSGAVWGTLPSGIWEIAPAPSLTQKPAWTIDYRRQLIEEPVLSSRRRMANVAVAIGSDTENPIRAVAVTSEAAAAGFVGDVVVDQLGQTSYKSIRAGSHRRLRQIQREMPLVDHPQAVEAARFMILEQSHQASESQLVVCPNGWLTLNDVVFAKNYGVHLVTGHPLFGHGIESMTLDTLATVI